MNKRARVVTLVAAILLGLSAMAFTYHVVNGGGNGGSPLGRTVSGY